MQGICSKTNLYRGHPCTEAGFSFSNGWTLIYRFDSLCFTSSIYCKHTLEKCLYFFLTVMRTHGSLRVILNTKIWPGMMVERASQKSIRLTGTDGEEGVKVFLLVVNAKYTPIRCIFFWWNLPQHFSTVPVLQ